jgi:hypothetical protein
MLHILIQICASLTIDKKGRKSAVEFEGNMAASTECLQGTL